MSAMIVIDCDGQYEDGTCARRVYFNTTDIAAAERAATTMYRWIIRDGKHKCPGCARHGR